MTTPNLQQLLEQALASANDDDDAFEPVAATVKANGTSMTDVEVILGFMEEHPEAEFGTPGALVHVIEKLFGAGYEQAIVESVQRAPTAHTTWMLNRVINGTKDSAKRSSLIGVLDAVANRTDADDETRAAAARFVSRLQ